MSPPLDSPLAEKSARTRTDTRTTTGTFRGTVGSNPLPSSAESSHVTDMYGDAQSDRTEPGTFRHLGSMHRFLELARVPLFKLPTLPHRYCWHRTD
jgi:hypothetical protein